MKTIHKESKAAKAPAKTKIISKKVKVAPPQKEVDQYPAVS